MSEGYSDQVVVDGGWECLHMVVDSSIQSFQGRIEVIEYINVGEEGIIGRFPFDTKNVQS